MPDRRTTKELFNIIDEVDLEVRRRIPEYLKSLGYSVYKVHDLTYSNEKRGNMELIHINCGVEINFAITEINLHVPLKHFDSLTLPTLLAEPVAGGSQYASGHP